MKLKEFTERAEAILNELNELCNDVIEAERQKDLQRTPRGRRIPKDEFVGYHRVMAKIDCAKNDMIEAVVRAESYPKSFPLS